MRKVFSGHDVRVHESSNIADIMVKVIRFLERRHREPWIIVTDNCSYQGFDSFDFDIYIAEKTPYS